jgi:hypothetical protein
MADWRDVEEMRLRLARLMEQAAAVCAEAEQIALETRTLLARSRRLLEESWEVREGRAEMPPPLIGGH